MEKICTNFNDLMLEEMGKVVEACNKNGTIISEVKFVNDSVGVVELTKPNKADGLVSVELKVIIE